MRRYTVKMTASFEDAVALVMTTLQNHGFRVIRSFDLASALDPDDSACCCPHHGTEQCTCRYTVLLAYGPLNDSRRPDITPRSITIHACDAEAYVGLSRQNTRSGSSRVAMATQEEAILRGLAEASSAAL